MPSERYKAGAKSIASAFGKPKKKKKEKKDDKYRGGGLGSRLSNVLSKLRSEGPEDEDS